MDFEHLPQNVMVVILMHMDYKDILKMKSMSKSWLALISPNQAFWRERFEKDFGEWEGGDVDFEKEYKIEYGWRFGEPRATLIGNPRDWVVGVRLKGSLLVSWSIPACVRVWDLKQIECLHEFQAETTVHSVAFDDEKAFIGLGNGDVLVFLLGSGERIHSWHAHNGRVHLLSVSREHIITGGDSCLKTWGMSDFELLRTFDGHVKPKRLQVDGEELICGMRDEVQVHAFNQEDGHVYTLDVGKIVCSVCVNSLYIFVGCHNGTIEVWSRESKEKVVDLDGGGGVMRGVWCDQRRLVSVSSLGRIGIWDLRSLTWIRSVSLTTTTFCFMESGDGRVVARTKDGGMCAFNITLCETCICMNLS